MKKYSGTVPPCGIFCGQCPRYFKTNEPCEGAQDYKNCIEKGCPVYLCTVERNLEFCFDCKKYPCKRFLNLADRFKMYGIDFCSNLEYIQAHGKDAFLHKWNNVSIIDELKIVLKKIKYKVCNRKKAGKNR